MVCPFVCGLPERVIIGVSQLLAITVELDKPNRVHVLRGIDALDRQQLTPERVTIAYTEKKSLAFDERGYLVI
jgi:hypothetical protein